MSGMAFSVLDARSATGSAAPTVLFRLRVEEREGLDVQSIALHAQVRIEPAGRRYSETEAEGLSELFGPRERWSQTMRPLLWTHAQTTSRPFRGETVLELPVASTYDFDVAASKLLDALEEGGVPLSFLFNGTVFARAADGRPTIRPIAWDCDAQFVMPVSVWRAAMDAAFPNSAWLRVDRRTFAALRRFKEREGHPTWDETLSALLGAPVSEGRTG
jgi:hypothetical protein